MIRMPAVCPECGADDCPSRFDEFLVLEFTDASYGAVHHLTVAAYMLQHSSRVTREGWSTMRELLREFVVENKSLHLIRKQNKAWVDSGRRNFKIKSKDGRPVIGKMTWARTIRDVRSENAKVYCDDVRAWAKSALADAQRLKV